MIYLVFSRVNLVPETLVLTQPLDNLFGHVLVSGQLLLQFESFLADSTLILNQLTQVDQSELEELTDGLDELFIQGVVLTDEIVKVLFESLLDLKQLGFEVQIGLSHY